MTKTPIGRKAGAVLATAALTMGLLTVGSVSAFAATVCTGEITDNVVGDLTVPADANCVLGGITVDGNVTVEPGGWLDATSTAISGGLTATDAYGVSLDGDSVGGDVVVASVEGGFLYLNDLAVTGNVQAIGVDTEINNTQIDGALDVTDAPYVDLYQSSVGGDATISGSGFGVTVAGTVVTGSLTIAESARAISVDASTIGGAFNLLGNGNGGTHDSVEVTGGAVEGATVDSGFVAGDGLAVSRELGSAPAGHPEGTSVLGADLDLKLPVAIGTGTYNATLTLTALS